MKIDASYRQWLVELKEKVRSAQIKAAFAVNRELILFYWDLGKMISEKLEESQWGDKVLKNVSSDLREEFPSLQGLSVTNLKYCKSFYLFYRNEISQQAVDPMTSRNLIGQQPVDQFGKQSKIIQQTVGQITKSGEIRQQAVAQSDQIMPQLVSQIPWGHNILIFTKCKEVSTALFYVQQTIENQWSRADLKEQLQNELHKRKGKAISNFKNTLPTTYSNLVQQTLKDPYIFDFLELDTQYREKDIENQLVKHVNRFLLELGKGFAFVGQQYPVKVSDTEYFLDLLFYHTRLKCYVVIELKNTKFQPEFAGKLNFYLSAVDSLVKADDDRPTIGLLLCREKDSIEAEFALRDIHKPIGISEYQLTKELPENLKSSLPTIEEIENQLNF